MNANAQCKAALSALQWLIMCGIVGTAFGTGALSLNPGAALDAIATRGPDGGTWIEGVSGEHRFGFGHALLAITSAPEDAKQPMWCSEHQCLIVFNGEIYNHKQLRAELTQLGFSFRTGSDTETLLAAYKAWGEEVLHKLSGMFAFAVWDMRDQSVFVARDRVGEKPLFYTVQGGALGFASTTRALGALGFTRTPDLSGLPTLLTFGYTRHGGTNYTHIHQLAPGHCMRVRSDLACLPKRYWRVSFEQVLQDKSQDERTRDLRARVNASVASMLDTTHNVALLLSGGIDSSITASVATRLGGGAPETYSAGFPSSAQYDETRDAQIVATHLGTKHHVVPVDHTCFNDLERMVDDCDGPFADSSFLALSALAREIRKTHRVALGGDGADEVFVGYPRFLAAEVAGLIPSAARTLAAKIATAIPGDHKGSSPLARAARLLRKASMPEAERLASWISVFEPHLGGVLTHGSAKHCDAQDALASQRQLLASITEKDPLSRTLHHNFETYLPADLLVKADRASMMHGLELRAPFLAPELVSYVASLPNKYKRRGLTTKWLLRQAYQNDLPAHVFAKKKAGFGLPLASWFRGPLRARLHDTLGPGARLYEYVQEPLVRGMLQRQDSGNADFGHSLFLLLSLEIWLRRQAL